MRKLALTTAVLLLALVGAGSARAHHLAPIPPSETSPVVNGIGGGTYRVTPAAAEAVRIRSYSPDAAVWSPAGTNSIPAKINRMQRAGRVLPKLSQLGAVGVLASTIPLFWKISEAGNDYYYRLTTDTAGYDAAITTETPGWIYCSTGAACNIDSGMYTDYPTLPGSDFWILSRDKTTLSRTAYEFCESGYCTAWWNAMGPNIIANAQSGGANVTIHDTDPGAIGHLATQSGDAFEDAELVPSTESAYNAAAANRKQASTYSTPSDATETNADRDAMGRVLVESDGSQSAGQAATEEAIAEDLYPGEVDNPYELQILQPLPNETYSAYITRLENAGWVGTATTVEEAAALDAYGPSAVTRIQFETTPGTVRTLDPLRWPATSPTIATELNITVRHNPATATPTPTEGGGVPGGNPGGDGVNFGPITEIDFGCKFPYGIFCYAIAFTELFDVTEDAPVFDFDLGFMGSAGVPAVGEAAYTVDLTVLDSYMSLWRSILSVCLWVGAIYFVATRFLGFHAGGDPGEAIEDVL